VKALAKREEKREEKREKDLMELEKKSKNQVDTTRRQLLTSIVAIGF
jgi:hypothetical protein